MIRKTISMPDTMGDWVKARIHQGQYNNESEYFRDLVRRDQQDQEQLAFLRQRLSESEADLEAGRYQDLGGAAEIDQLFNEIEASDTL